MTERVCDRTAERMNKTWEPGYVINMYFFFKLALYTYISLKIAFTWVKKFNFW